jgi:Na+-transporting methylmalonyl-CoA/oxaloacetate decarboxylase gamma subunit
VIDVVAALWIVILGMAIVFAVLGVLLGAMILLEKLTDPREEQS